jgi:hypothetical protein
MLSIGLLKLDSSAIACCGESMTAVPEPAGIMFAPSSSPWQWWHHILLIGIDAATAQH